ncbi:hypothetical protein ACWD4G_20330 [Streptomyces sp. NPDC002643]
MTTAEASGKGILFREQDLPAFRDHLHDCERCAHSSTAVDGCPDGYRIRWRLAPVDDAAELVLLARDAPASTPSSPSRPLRYKVMLLADELALLITHVGHHQGDDAPEVTAEVDRARDILALKPGVPEADLWVHARRLAHSVVSLRKHVRSLGGQEDDSEPPTFCWGCARMIRPGQPYRTYPIDSATGPGATVYLHDACEPGPTPSRARPPKARKP